MTSPSPEHAPRRTGFTTADPEAITDYLFAAVTRSKPGERVAFREEFLQKNANSIVETVNDDETREQFLLLLVNEKYDQLEEPHPSSPKFWELKLGVELVGDDYLAPSNSAIPVLAEIAEAREEGNQVVGVALTDLWQVGNRVHEEKQHSLEYKAGVIAALAVHSNPSQR